MISPSIKFFYSIMIVGISAKILKNTEDLCNNLVCDEKVPVCAIRTEGKGFVLKLYDNECKMIKEECGQNNKNVYEIIDLHFCNSAFKPEPQLQNLPSDSDRCHIPNCPYPHSNSPICGIRQDGGGFRIHQFQGKCELWAHNCEHNVEFVEDDDYLCEEQTETIVDVEEIVADEPVETDIPETQTEVPDPNITNQKNATPETETEITELNTTDHKKEEDKLMGLDTIPIETDTSEIKTEITTYESYTEGQKMGRNINVNKKRDPPILVIVDNMLTFRHRNISRRIDDFFETTHIFDLPLQEADEKSEKGGRRMWISNAGPVKIFKPWVIVPKNISDDIYHRPTLSSCFHKCPFECPNTYAPVCGVPGQIAREPTLMFQNHCFMDVAQCKMRWEDKSITAASSAYKESSFVFCLGDELNSLYRFLPLVKTLQHMGRLKKKGYFREKINMRFLNNIITRQPKLMG